MRIKDYLGFVNEADVTEVQETGKNTYDSLKEDLKAKIKKSLDSEDEKVFNEFVSAYIKNPESNQIQGLINDSDVYEFYLSNRNDVDSFLAEMNFYEEKPSDMNCFSLYDYIVKGTLKSISEIMKSYKEPKV
jgi:hypothetical protein